MDLLSSDLSAVPRGPGEHHRLVVVEHDVLPAELDIVVSAQITLAPLWRGSERGIERVRKRLQVYSEVSVLIIIL